MNRKIYIAIFALLVLVGGYFLLHKPKKSAVVNNQTPSSNQADSKPDLYTLGDSQAPITIVEYGHYKCPFCNRFYRETQTQIVEKYVKTGKAKLVWKDFPYEGGDAGRASEAAYCADDQNKFWEFHDKLFNYMWDNYYSKGINGEEITVFTDAKLKELASGLDATKFATCLESNKYAQLVKTNYDAGIAAGIKSTPTFFVNGQKVVGAQPFSVVDQIIQSKIK